MEALISQALWLQMGLILILILAHGFFAGSEIALVSVRRSRIKQLAEQGNAKAQLIHRLQEEPDRFIAVAQIGMELLSNLAAAVVALMAANAFAPLLQRIPVRFVKSGSEVIALSLAILAFTYFNMILGQLVPKSMALRYSEAMALFVARPIDRLSRLLRFPINLLTRSRKALFQLFGVKEVGEGSFVTEEEIKLLLQEGREKGIFDQMEQELISSVFEFTEASVKEVMVPRPRIQAIPIDASPEEVLKQLMEAGHSRYPVYGESLDDVKGILYFKDVLRTLAEKKPLVIGEFLHPVFFVPETMKVSQLLKELQRRHSAMAMVVDEYGGIEGLVTIEDLIEEIVGEIRDEREGAGRPVQRLKDGSLIIDASMRISDLAEEYGLPFPESPEYETLAGFVLSQLQRIPRGGEITFYKDYKLTVVDMEGRRIAKVKVERVKK